MAFLVFLALFLAITGHSSATYCVCKDGLGDSALQKTLDYACGSGADCTAILQNGGCFQPNTVKDHCSYAVNSYYQRKNQGPGTCDFSGTATTSPTAPSTVASSCVYQASPGTTGTSTGNGTSTGITPTTSTPGTTTTPSTTGSSPNIFGTGTGTGTSLGPAGSGSIDNNSGSAYSLKGIGLFFFTSLTLLFSAPFLLWG